MAALQAANSCFSADAQVARGFATAPNRTVRQNMGFTLCTPLACIDGVLLFKELSYFHAAHSQAGAVRVVRVKLGSGERLVRGKVRKRGQSTISLGRCALRTEGLPEY